MKTILLKNQNGWKVLGNFSSFQEGKKALSNEANNGPVDKCYLLTEKEYQQVGSDGFGGAMDEIVEFFEN